MGPSLQRKGPGRVSLPLQAPSRKPSLLSKLPLASAIRSYSPTAFFTAFISRRRDTEIVLSSANAETLAVRGPAKGTPHRAGFSSSPLAYGTGAQKRWHREEETRGKPCRTERSIANAIERLLFTCTAAWVLLYIMLIHLRNSGSNPAVSKTVAKNRW